MSAPPFLPNLAPLPPGWTQHIGPAGQVYYYHAQTQQSTYTRPQPSFANGGARPEESQKKKEKAHVKTPIPGTDWLRVVTTEGNVFYSNKVTKQSSWTVPPEITDAVKALEEREASQTRPNGPDDLEKEKAKAKATKEGKRKRVEDTVSPIDEIVTKKVKVDEDGNEVDTSSEGESSDEEEEEWQREAAEQLAKEAEEERVRREEEAKRREEEERKAKEEAEKAPKIVMPDRVDLSIDEGKALFKTLLREKDINPLHPWDLCLPKFISDPRYVLLPSVTARKEAFDEYCRERARELREASLKKERQVSNPKEDFDNLLKHEVTSTRASWTEFRRTWKKDRRFYGWGRDDKERERAFRDYLKALGEKKRAAAQKAEADFFAMLKEHPEIKADSVWKEVKKPLYSDPRYDAVGSSSLREELFNTYLKGIGSKSVSKEASTEDAYPEAPQPERESKEARRERALREREQKVKIEQRNVNMGIEKSRTGMNQEEGERLFKTMLVDAIRDPQATWDAAAAQLKIDPRFVNSPLGHNYQVRLFHEHIAHLRSKHLAALHSFFEEKTPSLDSRFSDLPVDEVVSSPAAAKLGYDINQLEDEFSRWQRERRTEARAAFDEMLNENSFVEFWGRLSKMNDVKLDQGLEITHEDLIGEEGDGSVKIDMKALAKTVDIGEMVKVLRRDKRYIVFDHIPEEREKWLRDYLSNMTAPKLSVHVP